MNKKSIFLIVIISLLFASAIPTGVASAAKKVTLTIRNEPDAPFDLILTGPKTIILPIKGHRAQYKIDPGIYTYTYQVCSQTHTGILDATKNVKIKVKKCPPGMADPITAVLENKTGDWLSIELIGAFKTYSLKFSPGKHTFPIVPGRYRFLVTGCGGSSKKGKVWFTNSYLSAKRPWTWACR